MKKMKKIEKNIIKVGKSKFSKFQQKIKKKTAKTTCKNYKIHHLIVIRDKMDKEFAKTTNI